MRLTMVNYMDSSFVNCVATVAASSVVEWVERRWAPLEAEGDEAWWLFSTQGGKENMERRERAEKAIVAFMSSKSMALMLRELSMMRSLLEDEHLRRRVEVLALAYMPANADEALRNEVNELEAQCEELFNTHRGVYAIDGSQFTENDARRVLSTTTDSAEAKAAWDAFMSVGAKTAPLLARLVSLRNEIARQCGFASFFDYRLAQQNIDPAEYMRLLDELHDAVAGPFAVLKIRLDHRLVAKFRLSSGSQLRPWHMGDLFFQETPKEALDEPIDLDAMWKDVDLIDMTRAYYTSIGFGSKIDAALAASDLFERDNKSSHAFAQRPARDSSRARMLANIEPNMYWAKTMIHEAGHCMYMASINEDGALPFALNDDAGSLVQEGIAVMFDSFTNSADFHEVILGRTLSDAAVKTLRAERRAAKLIGAAWCQVMIRFEKAMYEADARGEQIDLDALWWQLKSKYQHVNGPNDLPLKRKASVEDTPSSTFAAKIHILAAPVYYHSYAFGDMLAAQVRRRMAMAVGREDVWRQTSFAGLPAAGGWLMREIFAPANRFKWNDLLERATGERLTPKYFLETLTE